MTALGVVLIVVGCVVGLIIGVVALLLAGLFTMVKQLDGDPLVTRHELHPIVREIAAVIPPLTDTKETP